MGSRRELTSSPRPSALYAKAALPLLPGASLLPCVPGRGSELPEVELALDGVRPEPERLAAYARVCGFPVRDELPPTYPHVLAFPLHLGLMTDGRFPFPAIGLVHVSNRIVVRRSLRADEPLDLRVRATEVQPHPKGRTFGIVSEARVDGELAWEGESTMLRRSRGGELSASPPARPEGGLPEPPPVAEWRLPGDLGRRYAAASGDRNPIHMHALAAKAFGFRRAIAHGMWTKARCLAALEPSLPGSYTVEVAFRRPILLPGRVAFGALEEDGVTRFAVRSATDAAVVHLEGSVATGGAAVLPGGSAG